MMSKIILQDVGARGSPQSETLSQAELLAKYLAYALPDVAAVNPTSGLLLDKAIRELLDVAPHTVLS